MRKLILFIIVLLFSMSIYGQEEFEEYIVNKCTALLGKPLPDEFRRLDRTSFMNDEEIIVIVENGLIAQSAFGSSFDRTNEASEFNSYFYDYFENSNWSFYKTLRNRYDVYFRNNVYACIYHPMKRDDGQIVACILFSKNVNDF